MIFIQLEAFETRGTGNELVGELGLVVGVVIPTTLLIDLLVSVLRIVC